MAQNDFGWGSSQWRNRPMSTEIGDHDEPFQYQRPQARDRFSRIEEPVSPRSTTGITPTVQPPTALPPIGPTLIPEWPQQPTAPIGQMPSPAWAGRPTPTEPVRQETVLDADSFPGIPPATGPQTVYDSVPSARPAMAPVPGWGPPLPAAQTPPGIARSYPGRRPTIAYPSGPNPGPGVEIPGGAWLEQQRFPSYNRASPSSLRDLLRSGEQRLSNLRNDQRRISALEAPRNRPWSTEAIGDQGDPSIPAPNLGRPNFYGRPPTPRRMYPPRGPYEEVIDYGGPGNAFGWGFEY